MEGDILSALKEILTEDRILVDEPMNIHTTFRIGGPADILVKPASIAEIEGIINACDSYAVPYYVVGNGSNLLVGDAGIRGVVIQLGQEYAQVQILEEDAIWVKAGCSLSKVAHFAMENGLAGMEFAAGIPGSIGGAVAMNAGAYGGEMKDIVESVTLLTPEGEVVILPQDYMEFAYRESIVTKKNYLVLEVQLRLKAGEPDEIEKRMKELSQARREKQPLEYPSAGSTFKRPEGYFAGKLIMDAGLKGYRVGDAQVSEKHCGFVINRGKATAEEVERLMGIIQRKVEEEFGVVLEPEVRRLGDFT